MRAKKLAKFLRVIELLGRPTGATIDEMKTELEISRKSVYDQLNFIRDDMRFHVREEVPVIGSGSKRFSLSREDVTRAGNLKVPQINLNLSEIAALYFLKSSNSLYQGTEIQDEIDKAFVKLDQYMPDEFGEKIGSIAGAFVTSPKFAKDYSDKEEILETLITAIAKQRTCLVTYHAYGKDQVKTYRIAPLQLFEHHGGLYLFSQIVKYGEIRMQAIERIQHLKMEDETFVRPEDFNAEKRLNAAFGLIYDDPVEVKIWISADLARYVKERRWAEKQTFTDQNDGSTILEMKTSGWYEVKRWILSLGSNAQLISPEELRKDYEDEIKAMLKDRSSR